MVSEQNADSERIGPHPYKAIGVPHWRTCAVCGAGANARIHRQPTQDEVDAISGSAYTHPAHMERRHESDLG